MIRTIMTSKGKAQAHTGKETRNHLSIFIPRNMESPTEAQTSADKPAYCSNSFRLSDGGIFLVSRYGGFRKFDLPFELHSRCFACAIAANNPEYLSLFHLKGNIL